MGGKALRKCEVCGVRRVRKCTSGIFLARFPLEPNRCRLWVKATGNEDLAYLPLYKLNENKFICGDHFPLNMFNKNRSRLKKFAVPTLNLLQPPLSDDILESFPIQDSHQEKKDISLDCQVSTSKVGVGVHPDMPQVEEPAHNLKKRKCPASTSRAGAQSDMPHIEEAVHNLIKRQCPASTSTAGAHSDMPQLEEAAHNLIKRQCPASTSKIGAHRDMPRVEEPAHNLIESKVDIMSLDCPSSTRSKMSDENVAQFEERPYTFKEHKIDDIAIQRLGYSNLEMTPRKKKLIKKLQRTQNLLKTLSNSSINLDSLESDFLKDVVSQAVKNQTRKPRGQRWDMKTKISCLQIFKRSPRTYRHLQHNMPLPSVRTVQRLLQNIPMEPGINAELLKQLQDKAITMPPGSKLCTLVFDEISLKKRLIYNESKDKVEGFVDYGPGEGRGRRNDVADKALVFMIQGLKKKFKQPLAYYFVKGTISSQHLASLIVSTIKVLEDATFTVIATICDQGPTNCGALSQLKKNSHLPPDSNYFYVNSSKIYIIFDVPHLFKSIRNNFFEAGSMEMDGKRAKWQHLRDAQDYNQGMLYFHKITPLLLDPKQKMKMKVKYAAQTLSNTFAAILTMLSQKSVGTQYSQEIEQTSDIVRDLNKLFDFTNGPAGPKDVIKGKRENVSSKTNHVEVWNMFLKKIPTMKFLKNNSTVRLKNVRCVQGFVITIKSLKDIWFDCKKKGFKYVNLRQLNQDCLENFFGIVRQSSPTNRNPTCTHFTSAIKTVLVSGLNVPHSRGANCENDANKLLFTTSLKDPVCSDTAIPSGSHARKDKGKDDDEYATIMLPETVEQIESDLADIENQPVVYLSGYLAYRLLKGHDCQTCSDLLQEKAAVDHPVYKYIGLREWWKDKRSLTYPSIQLCRTTEEAVLCFKSDPRNILHEENVGQIFCTLMMAQINFAWWSCNSHSYMVDKIIWLIVKILIRRQCQIYNEDFIKAEETNANANKISQVQSTAK